MDGAETREWEQIRAAGRDRFVFREGILKRGFRDAAILLLIWLAFHILKHQPVPPLVDIWTSVVGFCVVTLVAGWIEGVKLWEKREREYEQSVRGDREGVSFP